MTIEFHFRSIMIEPADLQEMHPHITSALQPYLPTQKTPKRRRPRKKRETVAHLIDALIDSIDSEQ
jgi:hypothetical protein